MRSEKIPGSSLAVSYKQSWAPWSNCPANVYMSVNWMEVVVKDTFPLPLLFYEAWMLVKENQGRKYKTIFSYVSLRWSKFSEKNLDKFTQKRFCWINYSHTFVNRRLNEELSQGILYNFFRGMVCCFRYSVLEKTLLFWKRLLVEYFPETTIHSVVFKI